MAARNVAKRKTSGSPRQDNVADISPQPITFGGSSFSLLGSLLALPADLPKMRYDPKILSHRLDINSEAKGRCVENLSSVLRSVNETMMLMGKLLAGTGKDSYLEDGDLVTLGFTIHGLADLSDGLASAMEDIAQAIPNDAEGSHG